MFFSDWVMTSYSKSIFLAIDVKKRGFKCITFTTWAMPIEVVVIQEDVVSPKGLKLPLFRHALILCYVPLPAFCTT